MTSWAPLFNDESGYTGDPTYDGNFYAPAGDLYKLQMTQLVAPGRWSRASHQYGRRHDGLTLMKSDRGAWGVVRHRPMYLAMTELFVSRMAHYAQVPVVPTFIAPIKSGLTPILSIIPFERIVTSAVPFRQMAGYLKHYASCLPFFLWLGNDMDRAPRNMCMSAANHNHFAEYDFENTDLSRVFSTAVYPDADTPVIHNAWRMVFEQRSIDDGLKQLREPFEAYPIPILANAFEHAWHRLAIIPSYASAKIMQQINERLPVPAKTRYTMEQHLGMRAMALQWAYTRGAFEPLMTDKAVPFAVPERDIARNTYRFG